MNTITFCVDTCSVEKFLKGKPVQFLGHEPSDLRATFTFKIEDINIEYVSHEGLTMINIVPRTYHSIGPK